MRKKLFNFFAVLCFSVGIFVQASGIGNIPDSLNIAYGQTKHLSLGDLVTINPTSENVVQLSSESTEGKDIEIIPKQTGHTSLDVNVFGVKIKSVDVNVHDSQEVIVGGQSIGVALYTKGALVVGTSNIKDIYGNSVNPAKQAGIMSGDIIEKVNGIDINNADHVISIINEACSNGESVTIQLRRENESMEKQVTPVQDSSDKSYRMGIWVRDSMAGVGTMSFYNPATMKYASLGHAVYDSDTNTLLNLKSGEIVESDIYGIRIGEEGSPGELQGSFDESDPKIGNIITNNDFGLYGRLYTEPTKEQYNQSMKTARIDEIVVGPAKILTTLDDSGVKEYDIYIEKLSSQEYPNTKSMVIKVTDKELLEKTGGIVQGMSGSPIIQNGKVAGAVTHVFVNDPTKGYGLYAQWMLEQME